MLDLIPAIIVSAVVVTTLLTAMYFAIRCTPEQAEKNQKEIDDIYDHAVSMGATYCLDLKGGFSENTDWRRRAAIEKAIYHFIELESKDA